MVPAVPGLLLATWVWRDAPAEQFVLAAENALAPIEAEEVSSLARSGLALSPAHPRLLFLAGLAAKQKTAQLADKDVALYAQAANEAVSCFVAAATTRPADVFFWKEAAQSLDAAAFAWSALAEVSADPIKSRAYAERSGQLFMQANQALLRCIATDPDHARGYEGLARHYILQAKNAEATRLARLALTLAGPLEAPRMAQHLESQKQTTPGGQ